MTPRLRWSLVTTALVVAGLFGMHGLGDHDAAHGAMAPMTAMSSVPAAALHAAEHVAGTTDTTVAPASPDGMAGMAMELCVAILLGGLLAAYVVAVATRRTPWALPRLTSTTAPVPRGRAPDPPTPALLSVYRC